MNASLLACILGEEIDDPNEVFKVLRKSLDFCSRTLLRQVLLELRDFYRILFRIYVNLLYEICKELKPLIPIRKQSNQIQFVN